MAQSLEIKDAKRKGRNTGLVLGLLGTIVAGVVIKETTGKNIVDGADACYNKAKTGIKNKISEHKANKNKTDEDSKKE